MIKKILFYVAAFAVSLVFATNVYASDLNYSVDPSLDLVNEKPVAFSGSDYTNGMLDTGESFKDLSSSTDNVLNAFDNDLDTVANIRAGSGGYFSLKFDRELSIGSYYIDGIDLKLEFYNDGRLVATQYLDTKVRLAEYRNLKIKFNQVYIKYYNSSVFNPKVYEMEFFEDIVYLPVADLKVNVTDTTANFTYVLPVGSTRVVDHIIIDGKDVGKSIAYLKKDLKPDTTYKSVVSVYYEDGTIVNTQIEYTTLKEADKTPPGEVTDFKGNPDKTFVDLSWSLPSDDDYEKLLLYRDGVLLKTLTTETNYKDEKLNEDTTYKYKIVTVDKTGNKSEGKTITVLTKFTQTNLPPDEPLGLTAKPLSKGVKLSWKNPTSGSVKGYKIYMFEKDVASNNIFDKFVITAKAASTPTQVNTGLLSSTSYQVSGLQNGTAYGFYIVAVNSSGLSSVPSNTVYATPTINSVPPVNIGGGGSGSNGSNNAGFALSDVTNGVSTWFGGIWLILAFAIGIMVSFIIANRIKKLFVA